MIVVTAAQMQAMDRHTIDAYGLPGRVLMENAGRGATRLFLEHVYKSGKVGVMAGRGNNGGDGFVMARYLAQKKIPVSVFLLAPLNKVQGDAAANLKLLSELNVPVIEMPDAEHFKGLQSRMQQMTCWIDALLGTGLNSDVRGYFADAIALLNNLGHPIFAVDIPSGLNADTGQPCGISIRAAITATFGYPKIGHIIQPGASFCGQTTVVDIGIPQETAADLNPCHHLITGRQVHAILGCRPVDTHKGRTGHALVIAGSTGKTGAAAMSATSALRAGAGLVTLGTPQSLNAILEPQVTETMTLPLPDQGTGQLLEEAFEHVAKAADAKQVMAIGPGLGIATHTRNLISHIIKKIQLPMVIDADALNHLAGHTSWLAARQDETVLTPHPGEMARLSGLSTYDIQKDRVGTARNFAVKNKVCVVLKGASTVVASAKGRVWINPTGNPGMASGGMGDVLTGLITGLIAQGCTAQDAAIAGVYLHGVAADLLATKQPWGYLATEVMEAIPQAIGQILSQPCTNPLATIL